MLGRVVSRALAPAVCALRAASGAGRGVWQGEGRAHIELRGVHLPGTELASEYVTDQLRAVTGVEWVEVNAVLGRVVIGYDPELVSLTALVDAVAEAEHGAGLDEQPRAEAGVPHPSATRVLGHAAVMGANLAGLGYAVAAGALRTAALPPSVPALVSTVDATRRVRGAVESVVGSSTADRLFGLAGAVANTAAQRPMSLFADTCSRWCLLRESRASLECWQRWETEFGDQPEHHHSTPLEIGPRPVALPNGPIERVAQTSVAAGPTALLAGLGLGLGAQRAQSFLVASVPRAAALGREGFAAELGHALGQRHALVLDSNALRRLDRIDTVVIDGALIRTGQSRVHDVTPVNGETDMAALWEHAHALVDAVAIEHSEPNGWRLSTTDSVAGGLPADRMPEAERLVNGTDTLVLTREDQPLALVDVASESDPLAGELLRAAREAGTVLLAGDAELAEQFGVDSAAPTDLLATVRSLQADGHAVAVVSARDTAALAAADLGIGVTRGGPPWGADVITGGSLKQACAVLGWIPTARTVSKLSARLALIGSVTGTAMAMFGPQAGSQLRAATPVSTCALIALGAGLWQGMHVTGRPVPTAVARLPWHTMSPARVLHIVASSKNGLTQADAKQRAKNREETAEPKPGFSRAFMEELASPLTPALAAGAGISASIGAVTDAVIISAVLAANALIGAAQRVSADRAVRTLRSSSAIPVRVLRDGAVTEMPVDQLAVGDVVELFAGDAVAADCRLLEADGLEVDESSLTGESQLVTKTAAATPAAAVADRRCMVYQGTAIAAGQAVAVVVATGAATEAAQAAAGVSARRAAGVQARLQSLVKISVPISAASGMLVLAADLMRQQPIATAFGRAVSVAVAAVPEGLPFVATVAELAAARRLSRRGALVPSAPAIEALGRAEVLCFDKTGTLTEGRIALRAVSDGVSTRGLDALSPSDRSVLAAALRASPSTQDGQQLPHPTDRAIVTGAHKLGVCPTDGAAGWQVVEELPFEPSRGFHAVLGRVDDRHLLSVKGAPEVVLGCCTHWRVDGEDVPLDEPARHAVGKEFDRLARKGYRLLAVAERPATDRRDLNASRVRNLRLAGLIALADPVRPAAAEAVNRLQRAGVRVMMITGDHPSTAEAIAAELGILNGHQVLTGGELDALEDATLDAEIADVAVFARTTPAHKARIVRALQRCGKVVAVTGDGANDAPAIRIADVGIALGEHATAAARDAADVVVTDERIETIVDAIVEGRGMWSSVRDALSLLLGGNLGEIGFTVATGLISPGGSLNTRQMLLVNLLTDVLPAMAIAVRPPPDVTPERLLAEGPDASLGAALTRDIARRGVITAAAAFAAWMLSRPMGSRRHTDTAALVALVGAQLGQTLIIRGRTPLVVISSVASMAALGTIVQVPGLSHFFGCTPLWPHGWAVACGSATAATLAAWLLQRWGSEAPRQLESAEHVAYHETPISGHEQDGPVVGPVVSPAGSAVDGQAGHEAGSEVGEVTEVEGVAEEHAVELLPTNGQTTHRDLPSRLTRA